MSVDDLLRSAFEPTDDSWDRAADDALAAVRRRHARGVLLRRSATAGAFVAAVAAVAVAVGTDRATDDSGPDPGSPPSTSSARSVLDGRWRTEVLDEGDVRAALRQAGYEQYAEQVLPTLGTAPSFRLVWVVTFETAELRVVSGGTSEVLDAATVDVGGTRVTIAPRFAEGESDHEYALTGDVLDLTFVSTTEGAVDGVPGEVWQRLLYDAFDFGRA